MPWPGSMPRRAMSSAGANRSPSRSSWMKPKGFSLTPVQYAALVVVRAPPGVDQTRLVELVALDRSTIGNVVERLEAKGLLARLVDINNGLSRAPPRPVAAGHKASL